MTTLNSSAMLRWSESQLLRQADLGLAVDVANRQAEKCWIAIRGGKSAPTVLAGLDNLPDVLHAIGRLLQESAEPATRERLCATASLYEFTSDEFRSVPNADEKNVLSAVFAYVAWRYCRRMALWPEARRWEARCEQHVISQDDVCEYLRLSAKDRARTLPQFLIDPATLLVTSRQLRQQANQDPIGTLFLAIEIYRWVTGSREGSDLEGRSFFAGESAWVVANSLRLANRLAESGPWFKASAHWFSKTENPIPLIARVELSVAAALYNHEDMEEARSYLPRLLRIFSQYRMEDELHKCLLLEGMASKDLGLRKEAISSLSRLVHGSSAPVDPLVHGLGLAKLGETLAGDGALDDASRCFTAAIPLIEQAKVPWAIADCKAMLGEVLRDQGKVDEAIALYRSAIHMNLTIGLAGRTAYLRVVLAEALIMSGRAQESTDEILAALPILSREGLAPAATAALHLLQESIRRQKSDPDAVRRLRIELQKMKESANS